MFPNLCELLPELTDFGVADAEDVAAALKDSVSNPHGSKPWLAGAGADEAGLLLVLTDFDGDSNTGFGSSLKGCHEFGSELPVDQSDLSVC